jgi:hypothetical protein
LLVYICDVLLDTSWNSWPPRATLKIMYDAEDTSGDLAHKRDQLGAELEIAPSHDPQRFFDVCQKFAVIDEKIVVLGSANWAASSILKPRQLRPLPQQRSHCQRARVVTFANWSENSARRTREAGVGIKNKYLANYDASVSDDDRENGCRWLKVTRDMFRA